MYIYTSIWVIRSSEKTQLSRRLLHALRIIILIGAAWAKTSCLSPRKNLNLENPWMTYIFPRNVEISPVKVKYK